MCLSSFAVHVAPDDDVNDDDDAFSPPFSSSSTSSFLLPSLSFSMCIYESYSAQLVASPNGRLKALTVRWLPWGV